MGTTSRGNKPNEWASKINHTKIINDPFIQDFIKNCSLPKNVQELDIKNDVICEKIPNSVANSIQHFIAVDGGYTVVEPKKNFPSSQFAYFQFGAIFFSTHDLDNLSKKPFIFPEDMNKLHNLKPFKLALPIKNILSHNQYSLKQSIRKTIYDFFMEKRDNSCFMETLKWFVFEEYKDKPLDKYELASDPYLNTNNSSISLKTSEMNNDYTFDSKNGTIYLTDIFRFHEIIDEDHGATGILGYLTRLIEQLILVHYIKFVYMNGVSALKEILFITDGPLSFSGQTANMHKPMRHLCCFLNEQYHLFLVGIEKSGPFVEHANEIALNPKDAPILKQGTYCLLSNQYIYKYITLGDPSNMHYGSSSYYGGKVIFHTNDNQVIVLTVPTPNKDSILTPMKKDYMNLDIVLLNLEKLRCHMYDDSIIPIALVNKLVSLSNQPSNILLEKFTSKILKK